MGFFIDLNESLSAESIMRIKFKKIKSNILFKVVDSEGYGLRQVSLLINGSKIGVTNEKGVLEVPIISLPKKGFVKACLGIYASKEEFKL